MVATNRKIFLGAPLSGKTARLIEIYLDEIAKGRTVDQILFLSFFTTNARAISRKLDKSGLTGRPRSTTLQSFGTGLLKEYGQAAGLPYENEVISAAARGLLIANAWKQEGGALHHQFNSSPDAVNELTRIIDWVSQNRSQFHISPDELGPHELARAYRRYIALCDEHQLLTFQETPLRCIELLNNAALATQLHTQFPVVLVDDLHLARPEQLVLIERLLGPETRFAAAAWLESSNADPVLQHILETVTGWGEIHYLQTAPPHVNPAITQAVSRALGKPEMTAPVTLPISLATPFSVEDEIHSAARAIVQTLEQNPELTISDVAVLVAGADLLPFVYRIFPHYGLTLPPPETIAGKNPLIRGALLALKWLNGDDRYATERELFDLPYLRLDPFDYAMLFGEGLAQDRILRELLADESLKLLAPEATRAVLTRLLDLEEATDHPLPLVQLINDILRRLGAFDWAWSGKDFARADCDAWLKGFAGWIRRVGELEEIAERLEMSRDEVTTRLGDLEEEQDERAENETLQLTSHRTTNGTSASYAFIVGVSESAIPKLPIPLQLADESQLSTLFADGRRVVLPALREHAVWIEREARWLAEALSRGRDGLYVSVSQYGVGGDFQLPTPFFERLLDSNGEIDRDGKLVLKQDGLWRRASDLQDPRASSAVAEVKTTANDDLVGSQVLYDHSFSPSQLKTYLACPLQFYYGRVLGIETEGAIVFDRGSLLHEVLCATLGDGSRNRVDLSQRARPAWMNRKETLLKRALTILDVAWRGAPVEIAKGQVYSPSRIWAEAFGPALQQQATRLWAENILNRWAEFEIDGMRDNVGRRPILLEMPFTLELHGYHIRGRIDRIDAIEKDGETVYEIIDYKTGSSTAKALKQQIEWFLPAEGSSPEDFQVPIYALALKQGVSHIAAPPAAMHYINLEKLERKQKGRFIADAQRTIKFPLTGTLDARAGSVPLPVLDGEITSRIIETCQKMQFSPYPATPDYQTCRYCAFSIACDRGLSSVRGDS